MSSIVRHPKSVSNMAFNKIMFQTLNILQKHLPAFPFGIKTSKFVSWILLLNLNGVRFLWLDGFRKPIVSG